MIEENKRKGEEVNMRLLNNSGREGIKRDVSG